MRTIHTVLQNTIHVLLQYHGAVHLPAAARGVLLHNRYSHFYEDYGADKIA